MKHRNESNAQRRQQFSSSQKRKEGGGVVRGRGRRLGSKVGGKVKTINGMEEASVKRRDEERGRCIANVSIRVSRSLIDCLTFFNIFNLMIYCDLLYPHSPTSFLLQPPLNLTPTPNRANFTALFNAITNRSRSTHHPMT